MFKIVLNILSDELFDACDNYSNTAIEDKSKLITNNKINIYEKNIFYINYVFPHLLNCRRYTKHLPNISNLAITNQKSDKGQRL